MSAQPLPSALDARKAAQRGLELKGSLRPSDLSRFRSLLASDDGDILVELGFTRDEEERSVLRMGIEAQVVVICQRCLEPMPERLSCHSELAIVWNDQQAVALPRYLDPLIVEEGPCDIWAVVEEELMLAMAPFSYHDSEDCAQATQSFGESLAVEDEAPRKNPFEVLTQLKSAQEHQE